MDLLLKKKYYLFTFAFMRQTNCLEFWILLTAFTPDQASFTQMANAPQFMPTELNRFSGSVQMDTNGSQRCSCHTTLCCFKKC